MSQQINLYQPIFRKQKIIFSARTIVLVAAGLLVVLLLWSFLVSQRLGVLEEEYQRQVAAEQRALEQLTRLQGSAPAQADTEALEADINRLRQRRDELRASLLSLQQRRPVSQARMPELLDALTRQVPDGLWLTHLRLTEPERQLMLQGRALSSRLVPAYINGLSSEPLVSGTGFRRVQVNRSDSDIPGVSFLLRTGPDEGEP